MYAEVKIAWKVLWVFKRARNEQKINEKLRLSTNEQQKSNENVKICYIWNVKHEDKHAKYKKYCKVRDHYHYPGKHRSAGYSI